MGSRELIVQHAGALLLTLLWLSSYLSPRVANKTQRTRTTSDSNASTIFLINTDNNSIHLIYRPKVFVASERFSIVLNQKASSA